MRLPLLEQRGAFPRQRCAHCFITISPVMFYNRYALELEGIDTSIANLSTFPFVRSACAERGMQLHGAWFAIHHGELHWRNEVRRGFKKGGGEGGCRLPVCSCL